MTESHRRPRRKVIPERELTVLEATWIEQILKANDRWAGTKINGMRVVAECDCGECRTVYLDSIETQNPSLAGTRGYIGRIEIRTTNDFGITITLDHVNGKLSELYVNSVDLGDEGTRAFPEEWQSAAQTIGAW